MCTVHVSSGVENLWIESNKLEVMRGINPGDAGVPIYSYPKFLIVLPLNEFFLIQFVRLLLAKRVSVERTCKNATIVPFEGVLKKFLPENFVQLLLSRKRLIRRISTPQTMIKSKCLATILFPTIASRRRRSPSGHWCPRTTSIPGLGGTSCWSTGTGTTERVV